VQIDDAERARGARVTIGHRHGGNFGERDHVLELAAAFAQATSGISVVPGLPKIWRTPFASSVCSSSSAIFIPP